MPALPVVAVPPELAAPLLAPAPPSAVPPPTLAFPPLPAPTQVPPLQLAPAAHALPHAPQLAVLVCVSTQLASHCTSPLSHFDLQALVEQTWPLWHATPHAPQASGFDVRSTQLVPQLDWPTAHPAAPGGESAFAPSPQPSAKSAAVTKAELARRIAGRVTRGRLDGSSKRDAAAQ